MADRNSAPTSGRVSLASPKLFGLFLSDLSIFVSTKPGHSTEALIFAFLANRSLFRASVRAKTACLLTPYVPAPGNNPANDTVVTT